VAGRGCFLAGLTLTVLFGLGHLAGFLQAAWAARSDPRMADLTRAMRAHTASLLGFHPSILDFREFFSLSFSILLWLSAALGYAGFAGAAERRQSIRALSPCYVAGMALLLGASVVFSVPQGLVSCAGIAVLFGSAWRRSR
jgi:hypothetical protein